MFEIHDSEYHKVIDIININTCNRVYPLSIIEKNQNGQVFVDSIDNPKSVLFWHYCGFAYLLGKPNDDFFAEIVALIKNEKNTNTRRFVLQVESIDHDKYFSAQEGIIREERYYFDFQESMVPNETISLSDDFLLKEIDSNLLAKINGNVVPSFSWKSDREFLEKGKGYCILAGKEIAAVAFSSAISHDEIDIGIETNKEFRRLGFATIVAKKMIQYTINENKKPIWQCHTTNRGSQLTAEKLGFNISKTLPFFRAK